MEKISESFKDQHGLFLVQAREKTDKSENSPATKCLERLGAESKNKDKKHFFSEWIFESKRGK